MIWFFGRKREKEPEAQAASKDKEGLARFAENVRAMSKKIRATREVDALMIDLAPEICALFECERLTLYAVDKDKAMLYSKIKSGLESARDIVLPLDNESIAGWVALHRRTVRLRDAYNPEELTKYGEGLTFCRDVDERTGYQTRQMLAAPIFREKSTEVVGVIQLLNRSNGDAAFSSTDELGLNKLCKSIGMVFERRKAPVVMAITLDTSKYRSLVEKAVLSQPELDLAARSAQRKNLDMEDVLLDEFKVPLQAIGACLASNSKLTYERYDPVRKKPTEAIAKIDRDFVAQNHCVPIEDDGKNMTFLTSDPERTIHSGALRKVFPYARHFYRVTTQREFRQTVDDFFGAR
ncbi:MAG: GAF domain-containing protein [Burkholderiaceae bacterium]|nr:GAF domain-containing protein [Burkholderiaceae bacterium]